MLDKILIIDFEDSFTYNIANVLYPHEKSIKVFKHLDFFSGAMNEVLLSDKKHAVILGPGPGHPLEYQVYFEKIKILLEKENIFVMGICLGHQILGLIKGDKILDSIHKVHGQSVEIEFDGKKVEVQRYNSLSVWSENREVDVSVFARGVSYQFHPESIGTSDNDIFFKSLLTFIS